jgi:hypothetical protein
MMAPVVPKVVVTAPPVAEGGGAFYSVAPPMGDALVASPRAAAAPMMPHVSRLSAAAATTNPDFGIVSEVRPAVPSCEPLFLARSLAIATRSLSWRSRCVAGVNPR